MVLPNSAFSFWTEKLMGSIEPLTRKIGRAARSTVLSCWAARSIWQRLFDCVQGKYGVVELGPDPSTPPGSAQDNKVRGRAVANLHSLKDQTINSGWPIFTLDPPTLFKTLFSHFQSTPRVRSLWASKPLRSPGPPRFIAAVFRKNHPSGKNGELFL